MANQQEIFLADIFLTLLLVGLSLVSNQSGKWLARTIRESASRRHLELGEKIKISVDHCQFEEYSATSYKDDIFRGLLECKVVFSGLPGIETIPESFASKYNPFFQVEYSSFSEEADNGFYAFSALQSITDLGDGKTMGFSRIQIRKNTNLEELFISGFNYSDGLYEYGPKKTEIPIKDYLKE